MYKEKEQRRHPVSMIRTGQSRLNPVPRRRRGKRMPTVLCVIDTADKS
jgi:hypothetical protein